MPLLLVAPWPDPTEQRRLLRAGATLVLAVALGNGGGWEPAVDALSYAERTRIARYATETLRRRRSAALAWRRSLIGGLLDLPPRAVIFGHRACTACGEPHGKPILTGHAAVDSGSLAFNASSSADVAAIALRLDGDVGLDIEDVRRAASLPVSTVWLDPDEQRLVAADVHLRRIAWVRKEAVVKATGDGLNRPLTTVPVIPIERVRELSPELDVVDLELPFEVTGAVAGPGLGVVTIALHPALDRSFNHLA